MGRDAIIKAVNLASNKSSHPFNQKSINASSSSTPITPTRNPFYFFPATGKSRKGAFSSLGDEISNLLTESNVPGVYLQGLFCVDGQQNVIFEQKLATDSIIAVEEIVEKEKISIVGYDGDDLYTTKVTEIVQHLHEHYGEPMPTLLPGKNEKFLSLSKHSPRLHKILLLDDDVKKLANVVRPQLEALTENYNVTITQAVPTMLEVLPAGCSKAVGVQKVCEALGIDMGSELLALGDAENDAEMLNEACIGVAMGNGCNVAKRSADYVMNETNDDGAAGLAMEIFSLKK